MAFLLAALGRQRTLAELSGRVVEGFKEEVPLRGAIGKHPGTAHAFDVCPAVGVKLMAEVGQDVISSAVFQIQTVCLPACPSQFPVGFHQDEESLDSFCHIHIIKKFF